MMNDPRLLLGSIDIYLLDQVLKGRIEPGMEIFDAGCGGGRNLAYFLRAGFEVAGIDLDLEAIASVRRLAEDLAPHLPPQRFRVGSVESLPAKPRWRTLAETMPEWSEAKELLERWEQAERAERSAAGLDQIGY